LQQEIRPTTNWIQTVWARRGFAIEELAPEFLLGAYLEVDEERYNSGGIRRLYESVNYPLIRGAAIDPQDLQPAQEQDLNHGAKFSKSKPLV
jgi:hypothetical protein